jgi:ribonucleoside-diphosphate reductase alpha chain
MGSGPTTSDGRPATGSGSGAIHAADALASMIDMGDAPSCHVCGSIMVRNGSCYKCMSCGSTSGCS